MYVCICLNEREASVFFQLLDLEPHQPLLLSDQDLKAIGDDGVALERMRDDQVAALQAKLNEARDELIVLKEVLKSSYLHYSVASFINYNCACCALTHSQSIFCLCVSEFCA